MHSSLLLTFTNSSSNLYKYTYMYLYNCLLFFRPLEKDNASQSSTDTAMSSESPNQTTVKPEPVEAIENGERDPQPLDVTPRKKPRKQLL